MLSKAHYCQYFSKFLYCMPHPDTIFLVRSIAHPPASFGFPKGLDFFNAETWPAAPGKFSTPQLSWKAQCPRGESGQSFCRSWPVQIVNCGQASEAHLTVPGRTADICRLPSDRAWLNQVWKHCTREDIWLKKTETSKSPPPNLNRINMAWLQLMWEIWWYSRSPKNIEQGEHIK